MNRNLKATLTILLMCIIVGGIFLAKKSIKVTNIQKVMDTFDDITVKQISDFSDLRGREIYYSGGPKKCKLEYRFFEVKNKYHFMSLRYLSACTLSFEKQKKIHRRVLKRANIDWDFKKIKNFNSSSLHSIEPSLNWNKEIILAALKSKDVLDYKKNYPNHKSKKGINTILIETINNTNSLTSFLSLYKEFGLNFILTSCEKVFQMDRNLASKYKIDIGDFKTVIYDAGVLNFSRI